MTRYLISSVALTAAMTLMVHDPALSQTAQLAPGQVSGAELQAWLDADGLALGGVSLDNGCQFLAKNKHGSRHLSVICPNDMAPWTVKGEGKVDGDRWCSKFRYPDGSSSDTCEEFFKLGENRYEVRRTDGHVKHRIFRLIP